MMKIASHTYNYDTVHGDLLDYHVKDGHDEDDGIFNDTCRAHQDWIRVHPGWLLQINDRPQVFFDFNFEIGILGRDGFIFRRYLVKVPVGYPLEKAGPIFCAGENICALSYPASDFE